ncbi:FtsK/SpoIIIE domain-containing protein [Ruicaihuangia caeni]|uniref:FtsK/SpoIIIE domain-containing protein n=1 Tax=Ruicaihuangia caeni TaxID=3042517 RepID=UPI0033905A07
MHSACLAVRVIAGPDCGAQARLDGRLPVGRSGAGLALKDERVSRFHAVIALHETDAGCSATIADAGSSGGTLLNGREVDEPVSFTPGTVARLGDTSLLLLEGRRFTIEPGPRLELLAPDGTSTPITVPDSATVVIGRRADIVVDDPAVSRRHLQLRREGSTVVATDLGSRNGVSLHGRRLDGAHALRPGDELLLRGSGYRLLATAGADPLPNVFELLIRAEPVDGVVAGLERAVRVRTGESVRVRDVASALAEWLGLDSAREHTLSPALEAWTLYRADDGLLLHPDDQWVAAPLARGDTCTVARAGFPGEVVPSVAERVEHVIEITPRLDAAQASPGEHFQVPRPPEQATLRGRGLLWQLGGGALGVVGGLALGAVTGNWLFALFGAIAGLGTMGFGILAEHSRRRAQAASFLERLDRLQERVDAAIIAEADRARMNAPPASEWEQLIERHDARLWCRRPRDADFLALTLGGGVREAAVRVETTPGAETGSLADAAQRAGAQRLLPRGPVPAPAGGVLGIAGPARQVDSLVAHLLLEAAVLHAPSSLSLTLLATDDGWDWARWLPHLLADHAVAPVTLGRDREDTRRLAERLVEAIVQRRQRPHNEQQAVKRLVVITREALVDRESAIDRLLQSWTHDDGLLVVLADEARSLPVEATVRAVFAAGVIAVHGAYERAPIGQFDPVSIAREPAVRLARDIGRLRDPRLREPGAAGTMTLLELAGIRRHGSIDLAAARAARMRHDLSVAIGVGDDGDPVMVDLAHDGPHGVIAGTTGSGKSEVLASLLAALVGTHRASELALFLIDFKGGATFARFADLPHTAGVVTDLEGDASLARRAFTALESELRRRKSVLARAGCADLGAYRAAGEPDGAVPSLLVVIDEFALLVQQQPEVKSRLDTVASQGRSLGVHLLLATQSPGGVITPAIRANTNLWLCLRVVNESESRELLGTDEAARLPIDRPGRVLLRRGAEQRTTAFQCARVTVPLDSAGRGVSIEPFADAGGAAHTHPTAVSHGPSELDALLTEATGEMAAAQEAPAPRLWLPPLSSVLPLGEVLDEHEAQLTHHWARSESAAPMPMTVPLGRSDLVQQQSQAVFTVDLSASHLLLTGAPGSGRSAALVTVAAALAHRSPPDTLHLYALTGEHSLRALELLPHAAAVVQVDDDERVRRMLARLQALIEARRSGATASESGATVLLLIDDYVAVRETLGDGDASALESLHRIIANGRAARVHVAMSTSQPTDLRLGVFGSFSHRLMLRLVDRSDALAIDWRPGADDLPPPIAGRAMTSGPIELQLAYTDEQMLRSIAASTSSTALPRGIERMPRLVEQSALLAAHPGLPVLGVGGPELEPVLLDTRAGAHLVVLGEQGSGRSTALAATVAAVIAAAQATSVHLAAIRPGPLDAFESTVRIAHGRRELDSLLNRLEAHAHGPAAPAPALLVIDDADELVGDLGDRFERLLRTGRERGLLIAVSARAADWVRSFDPWVRYLGSLRHALVLSNFVDLAPLFDVRLPQRAPAPRASGRGYLIASGEPVHMQVSWPSNPTTATAKGSPDRLSSSHRLPTTWGDLRIDPSAGAPITATPVTAQPPASAPAEDSSR